MAQMNKLHRLENRQILSYKGMTKEELINRKEEDLKSLRALNAFSDSDDVLELALFLQKQTKYLDFSKDHDKDQTKRFIANLFKASKNHPINKAKRQYNYLDLSSIKDKQRGHALTTKFDMSEFEPIRESLDNPD